VDISKGSLLQGCQIQKNEKTPNSARNIFKKGPKSLKMKKATQRSNKKSKFPHKFMKIARLKVRISINISLKSPNFQLILFMTNNFKKGQMATLVC